MDTATKISDGGGDSFQRIGSYVILGKLGEGGMGAVYKAHDPQLDRTVAVKVLPSHLAGNPEFVARFKREASAAAKISHQHLVQVHAAGEDDGTHFIVMELVEGTTLRQHIEQQGKLPVAEALTITLQAADALGYAWRKAHLIHRDIKPENILLSEDGEVKVADLGLAKTLEAEATSVTTTGVVMGSPHYISPEQAEGVKEIDYHTDIYSLGCTLFHMLTGRPPYEGDKAVTLLYKHVHDPVPDPAVLRPDCPPRVTALIKQMLAKKPAQRPADYDTLIAELTALYTEVRQAAAKLAATRTRVTKAILGNKKLLAKMCGIAGAVGVVLLGGLLLWSPWKSPVGRAGAGGPRSVVAESPVRMDATERVPPIKQPSLKENLTLDLGSGVTMEFVLIQPGTFTMGSDECSNATPHKVTITKPFYLGKYEVTQEQWQAIMGSNPSQFKGPKNPVEKVSWEDCQMFLRELQEKVPGQKFRLPTEAEWEYACRAGSTTKYCYGDDDIRLGAYAWYKNNFDNITHPVGEKKPNAWGLHDMLGNVREWCADWYGDYDFGAVTDPVGPSTGSNRVLRGGSWGSNAANCRSANRDINYPSTRINIYGLRVVVVVR